MQSESVSIRFSISKSASTSVRLFKGMVEVIHTQRVEGTIYALNFIVTERITTRQNNLGLLTIGLKSLGAMLMFLCTLCCQRVRQGNPSIVMKCK